MQLQWLVLSLAVILKSKVQCQDQNNNSNNTLVQIPNGPLRGKELGMYYSWESIPYAEPPIGDLRFEAPQPYRRQWTEEFNATNFPYYCTQWYRDKGVNRLRGKEDCLTVNVYTPKPRAKYPVMVFLHGGKFMLGGALAFDPEQIMASGKIIVVKVTYRVGPLGFLSTEDDIMPGNYGLKDQQLALQWVKENIANFGGDPKKIMLLGFSAGGASTHLHLLQPSLKDLVKVAVSVSGVALNPWVITKNARENAFRLGALVNCTSTSSSQDLKNCLKSCKDEDIVEAVQGLLNFGYNPFTTFGPVVEPASAPNAFLTQHPVDIIKSGSFSHIPWLVSYAKEDGAFNAAELLRISSRTGVEFLNELNDNWLDVAPQNLFLQNIDNEPRKYAQTLKELYLGSENFTVANYPKVQNMYTDILFKNGILRAMELHRRYSKAPVYGYIYDNPANYGIGYDLSLRKDVNFGTSHMDDITLIMDLPMRSTPRPDEVIVSQKLVQMLVDFAESEKLSFGDCVFENNADPKEGDLKLMLINRDQCGTVTQEVK